VELEIDIASEVESEAIRDLDLGMFDQQDLVNLILQRSEVLYDLPRSGRVIREWNNGNMNPIIDQVERLGDEIAYRTAAVIHAEYKNMAPMLKQLAPKRVADIGCGYAFFDLFLARDLGTKLLLIDLESNERRHFGFKKEGAAYSSLARAKEMLMANQVAYEDIHTVNPEQEDPAECGKVDLVTSFLSCGFHYPVSLYDRFFTTAVQPSGSAIIDLREATAEKQLRQLQSYGLTVTKPLDSAAKVRRVLLGKDAA
jgi:SAM-dependent methyltransferase